MLEQTQEKKSVQSVNSAPIQKTQAVAGGVSGVGNAQKTQNASYYTETEIAKIQSWYTKQDYSLDFIQEIQRVVGVQDHGTVDAETINAVRAWQEENNLTPLDGMFGRGCATFAGLSIKKKSDVSSSANASGVQTNDADTTSDGVISKVANGLTAAMANSLGVAKSMSEKVGKMPLFQKQTDYPNSPYVSRTHYNEMKTAMGDTDISEWNISDSRISGIYSRAKSANNGDKSTISSSGCGVTAYANLKRMRPTEAAELSMQDGYRVYNAGTDGTFFTAHGATEVGSASAALDAVEGGKSVICSVQHCHWTSGSGHYILVYGCDGDYVYVSDSNSSDPDRALAPKSKFLKSGIYKHGYAFD